LNHALTIRKAKKGDEALILSFIRALAEYERAPDEVKADEGQITATLFADNPRVFCDIAEWNGKPAGFAAWFYNFSTWKGRHGLYLEDLFVHPEFRGHGIGKALMTHLARQAVENNCARFEWWVLDWNRPSIEFYKALGAEAMDGWTVFRITGDALMRLANA
jgi:GNAT superfamily N-acetyltransferase